MIELDWSMSDICSAALFHFSFPRLLAEKEYPNARRRVTAKWPKKHFQSKWERESYFVLQECDCQLQDIPGLDHSGKPTQQPAAAFTITFKHTLLWRYIMGDLLLCKSLKVERSQTLEELIENPNRLEPWHFIKICKCLFFRPRILISKKTFFFFF